MKRIMLALVTLLAGAGFANADVPPGVGIHAPILSVARPPRFEHFHGGVSFGAFYDTLSPYGDWVYVGSYGRVWRPSAEVVGAGFRPYGTGGHWIYTDYGWSWESDWDWGWAPFHYGRWLLDSVYGWVWVPGDTWGPAWVDWRFGGGYVGWAPLAPVGLTVSYEAYSPWWVFVESPHFCDYGVYRHAIPYNRVVTTAWPVTQPYRQTIAYGRGHFYAGPPATHIATAVGVPIAPVHVAAPRPGVITAVQPHVTANPNVARAVGPSPYHAIASGRVAPAPQMAMPARPVAQPIAPTRPAPQAIAPARPVAQPIAPARPVAQPIAPARPVAQPIAPARPAPPAIAARPAPQVITPARPVAPAPVRAQPIAPARPQPMMPAQPRAYPAAAPRAQPMMPPRPYVAPAPARPAPQQSYRAPAPSSHAAPAASSHAAPAPSYHAAPAPSYHAAPAPSYHAAPAPRSNPAVAHPDRRR
jgi:hypothetical protein